MEKRDRELIFLFARYFVLLLLGAFNLWVFYFVFTPATVFPVFWVLKLFDNGTFLAAGQIISFKGNYVHLVSACIAGAAYYLLAILNLTTSMKWKTRVYSILFLFGSFLIINVIRIILFVDLFVRGYEYFGLTHLAVWYFGSTLLVGGIWFGNVKMFKIKKIPVYTDFKKLSRILNVR